MDGKNMDKTEVLTICNRVEGEPRVEEGLETTQCSGCGHDVYIHTYSKIFNSAKRHKIVCLDCFGITLDRDVERIQAEKGPSKGIKLGVQVGENGPVEVWSREPVEGEADERE